jgi:hypothetical protein
VGAYQYYLFSNPSFLSGIARTLDIGGHFDFYNFSKSSEQADATERYEDWMATYFDLYFAWLQLASENPEFIEEVSEAISKDPYLAKIAQRAMEASLQESNEEALQRS